MRTQFSVCLDSSAAWLVGRPWALSLCTSSSRFLQARANHESAAWVPWWSQPRCHAHHLNHMNGNELSKQLIILCRGLVHCKPQAASR